VLALSRLMESVASIVKTGRRPSRLGKAVRQVGRLLLDQLYPPICLVCEAPIGSGNGLCARCFGGMRPITAPLCPRLGIPFQTSLGADALSAEALADPPPFGRARAALVYNDMARHVVSGLKYGDRPELAQFCARLMAGAGHELWAGDPVLVPVPLHPSRQRQRRYNQSTELAMALGRLTGLRCDPLLVQRRRKTRQQVGLSGDGRARNVAGAFAAHPELLARLAGRRVVLVDDVYTTGASTKAVTRTLLRGGAEAVDVVTFARVVIGVEMPI
jgi:ComF family protein